MSYMFTDCFCSFIFCSSCPLTSLSFSKHVLPLSLRSVHGNLASKDIQFVCVQWTRCDLVDLQCYRFLFFRCVNGPPKPVNIHLTIHLTCTVFIKTHSLTGCVTLSSCLEWFLSVLTQYSLFPPVLFTPFSWFVSCSSMTLLFPISFSLYPWFLFSV